MLGGFSPGDDCSKILLQLEKEALAMGLSEDSARYLPRVYGKRCLELFRILRDEPGLAAPIAAGHPYVMAQVVYAIKYEAAQTLADVLCRRIRLALLDRDTAVSVMAKVHDIMAAHLAWRAEDRDMRLLACRAEME